MVYTLFANYFVISAFYTFDLFPIPSLVLMVEQVGYMILKVLCNILLNTVFLLVEILNEELFFHS